MLATLPLAAQNQGLHEKIGVDGKYIREVTVQNKIFTLPKRLDLTLESTPVSYFSRGVATPFAPGAMPLPTVTPFATRAFSDSPGYLELALGSYLDGNLSAGYSHALSESTTIGAYLQVNATALYKPKLSEAAADVKRRLADGRLGIHASHRLDKAGSIDGILEYRLAGFNYFGYAALGSGLAADADRTVEAPTQTINEVNFKAGWHSAPAMRKMKASATLGLRYFGYRALYSPRLADMQLLRTPGSRETDIYLNASAAKTWSGGSQLGIDLDGDLLLYSGHDRERASAPESMRPSAAPDNYGMVSLTPFYRFSRGLLNIRLGARIDLTFNAGPDGDRYDAFHIAPDIRLDWRKGGVGLFLDATGGSQLQTLASLHALDYYAMPATPTTHPVYIPVDAAAGANFGPFAGFTAGVAFRYKVERKRAAGGWYTAMLNYGLAAMPGLRVPEGCDPSLVPYSCSADGIDTHGFSLAAHIGYRLGEILEVKGEGTYQPQNGKTGYFNGYDRPRWTASATLEVRPVKPLSLEVQYEYRGVRHIYMYGVPDLPTRADIPVIDAREESMKLISMRLPDLTMLNARASWAFTPKISIFAQATNILNRHDPVLPLQPTAGISVAGGCSVLF